jgi:hypothetical protein
MTVTILCSPLAEVAFWVRLILLVTKLLFTFVVKTNKDFHDYKTPIGYHDQNVPQISTLKTCICNDKGQPIGGRTPRRIKRASSPQPASLTPPSPAAEQNQGPGYACADVMIVEVKKDKVRVVDGFGLSAATLMPDENWGGRQSFTDVSIRKDQNGSLMILVKRPLDGSLNR